MTYEEVLAELRAHGNPDDAAGMARFGINADEALGVRIPVVRALAKRAGRERRLARRLWASGVHEARILAGMVDEPAKVTPAQMDRWAAAFDSWDLCDQVCMNLFDRTPYAWDKALEWSGREAEFVKRAGFALMACLAWHDKAAADERFAPFFAAIEREAWDRRNFVKKAVNWALRQIGKRNRTLRAEALRVAERIARQDSPTARWIAADARRELLAR
jgi:3-methyladenine DNA glycosylase AlkD